MTGKIAQIKIHKVSIDNKKYPKILKEITKPPKVIYYRGALDPALFDRSIAIVGSRKTTQYGKIVIDKLVCALIERKVTIISGFMYGADSEAHKKCLEYGGKTIAVLGNGLNIVYPPENEGLYIDIIKNGGVIISEYEPDFKPQLWTFPQRNRIVAGLSTLGVIVTEANEGSGSLITAKLAAEQKKPVYAIPGPITSFASRGTNALIKNKKAQLITCAQDIFGEKEQITLFDTDHLDDLEKKIYKSLGNEPLTADALAQIIGVKIADINKALSFMSIKGVISESTGKYFLAK